MQEIFSLRRQEAEHLTDDGQLYDALLDIYEPGANTAEIAGVFSELRTRLAPLIAGIAATPTTGWPSTRTPS